MDQGFKFFDHVIVDGHICAIYYSLVPGPHPLRGKRGLVNLDSFLGLAGSVRARRHRCTETNLGSDWSVMLLGRGPTIQIYIAGNGALHSCGWRVI